MVDTLVETLVEQLYDELQHHRLVNYGEYRYELEDLAGDKADEVDNLLHNRYSFGFCDMCDEVIFYDDDTWYDVCCAEPYEQDILEITLPKWQKKLGCEIQDVCPVCWHKLLDNVNK